MTTKEKVLELINKELDENYEIINNEKNYYHDDLQAVKTQTNFLAKMLLDLDNIKEYKIDIIEPFSQLRTKIEKMRNNANESAESLNKKGMESSSFCSQAMETAYNLCLIEIENTLSEFK